MKKYRPILDMQLSMLDKARKYNEEHERNPNTRLASGEIVTCPVTKVKYKVVG